VPSLGSAIAGLARYRRQWDALVQAGRGMRPADVDSAFDHLDEVQAFGSNPGALRMFKYVPARPEPALVVVLHGCTQTAASYDFGAGWSTLADRYGFVLLLPQQQPANNPNRCFNWFLADNITREKGEALSIRQMVETMIGDHDIDRRRVFVTGLSAGGAMTSVMLATYPEVFAAGAIIAGLPYGVATNVREALNGMFQSPARPAIQLGDLVRGASRHRGAWPKVSVWHGSADRTVNPANADEIVKQWLDVHQLPSAPMSEGTVDGYPRQVWWNSDGETIVESYTITDMAHGTPIGTAENDQRYGIQGAFLIEAGISSSYHIANFFGLTSGVLQLQKVAKPAPRTAMDSPSARLIPLASPIPTSEIPALVPDLSKVLWPLAMANQPVKPSAKPEGKRRRVLDVGAVITRALTAAGLMK
jgi:poly(hydroxyalkanoate) depolymerase family esterase